MKNFLVILICSLFFINLNHAQNNFKQIEDSILAESVLIYQLEGSARLAKKELMTKFSKKYLRKEVDDRISYKKGDSIICVYYSNKNDEVQIKNTFIFKANLDLDAISTDNSVRNPSEQELQLISIHNHVYELVKRNPMVYTKPQASELRPIIFKNGDAFRVYLIVFRNKAEVPFGNDYLVNMDSTGSIINWKRIHKSFLTAPYIHHTGYTIKDHIHTHLQQSPFISTTDICLVLLAKPYIKWESITTISDYRCIYDIINNELKIELFERSKD